MRTATLEIRITSPECASYRLLDASGRVVWSNRVYNTPAGHEGASTRMAAWTVAHGYTVTNRMESEVMQGQEQR